MSEDRISRVSVRLLDREYQVACPMDERSDLLDAAEYLDGKMREISSGVLSWMRSRARPSMSHPPARYGARSFFVAARMPSGVPMPSTFASSPRPR